MDSTPVHAIAAGTPPVRLRFLTSLASLAGGTAIGQGLMVLASPIISRQYGPEEIGVFSMFATIALLLNTVNSLRYEMAITVAKDEESASQLLVLCGVLVLGFCLLLAGSVWAFGPALSRLLKVPSLAPHLWFLPLTVGAAGAFEALNFYTVRRKAFGPLAQSRVIQGAGQSGVQILLGLGNLGTFGLVTGDLAGRAFSAIRLAWGSGFKRIWSYIHWRGIRSVAAEYIRFPKYMAGATLFNIAGIQVPFLLIPAFFGAEQAGHYFIAYRTLFLPTSFIGAAISQVFLGEAAERVRGGEPLQLLTARIFILLAAVYLPIYTVSLAGAGLLFPAIFGPRWGQAGHFAQILAPMTLVWSLARPISSLLLVRDRLKESLAFTLAELIGIFAAILVGARSGSMIITAFYISGFGLLTSIVSVGRFLHAAGVDFRVTFRRAGILTAFNIPLGLLVWGASHMIGAAGTAAAAVVGMGVVAYASKRYLERERLL